MQILERTLPALCLGALAAGASAQVTLTELVTIDLDPTADPTGASFVGSNPSCVAWDGADLFIAGFNNSGADAEVAVVKVVDALGAATFDVRFGALSTPTLRGYSGLDVSGGVLAAAYDDGAADPNGITGWDLAGGFLWARDARGGSGAGFDPGFPGGDPALGSGVGWTTFGSGRRALQNATTGADIWTTGDGMIINGAGTGTFWRDMDFDDATGDVWLREGNNLIQAVRSGDNGISGANLLFDSDPEADFVNGQNVAFLDSPAGDAVIWNDRGVATGGQALFDVVQVVNPDGSAATVDWGSFAPADGNGYYDFSWHAASHTLALLDFNNRNVHLFQLTRDLEPVLFCDGATEPCPCGNPGAAGGCANSTGAGGVLSASGSTSVALDDQVFSASGLLPANAAVLVVSDTSMAGNNTLYDGVLCLAQPFVRLDVVIPDGAGDASWGPGLGALGIWGAGDTRYVQGWYRDPAGPCATTANFTNALEVTFTP